MEASQVLIVETAGAFLGKHSERLTVRVNREVVQEVPLLDLEGVLLIGRGISVSTDALGLCCERGVPVHVLDGHGEPVAGVYAAGLTGTVLTRRAQLRAMETERGPALARALAAGKIENQARLLRYFGKYRQEAAPEVYAALRLAAAEVRDALPEVDRLDGTLEAMRERLLATEGRAAQKYWAGVRELLPAELGWPGRVGRGARDPFNMALNYGYGVLYGQVERALVLAGLDPYAGFIHADRPGKPSLVLDLIEIFRAPVVDRALLALLGKGGTLEREEGEDGFLTLAVRRTIAERVLARLDESNERYEGKRHRLRTILQSQARHLATFLRGEREAFVPFRAGW